MVTTPGQLELVSEVQASTVGDQVPNAAAGGLILFSNGGIWYSRSSAGVITPLAGVTSVTALDTTVDVAGTTAVTVARHAITGDVAIGTGSNVSTLASLLTAGGPTGSASVVPVITWDAKGRLLAVTTATITPAAIGAPSGSGTSSGTNTGDQTITLTGDVTGSGTGSFATAIAGHHVTNAMQTQIAAHSYRGNNTGSTADVLDLTNTQVTADLVAATTSLQGMMSASDKSKMNDFFDNGFYNIQDHGVKPGNSAGTNDTAMAAFIALNLDNIAVYWPPGVYQFSVPWPTLTGDMAHIGVRGHSQIALTANMAGNFITLLNTGFYSSFTGLYFANFVTQTAGYVIECQNNANVLIQDCFFVGGTGQTLAGGIDFTGTNSGNGAVLRSVYMAGFTGSGINVASALDTIYMQDLEFVNNQGGAASVGIACSNGGAIVMVDCQIIDCNVNVLLAPTVGLTVASVFASNCFFDQGRTQSMRITGAGTVTRSHFDACWFTLASTGAQAIQIDTTGSSAHAGLLFSNCHILNTPTAATSDGLVATAVADITVIGCQIAGWVNGIQVTPSANSPTILNIGNNIIGTSGGVAANTTGIKLNVGGTTYGQVLVEGNSFLGNTTPLSDASTVAASTAKVIGSNAGMSVAPVAKIAASAAINTTETYVLNPLPLPANSLSVGTVIRATLIGTCTSTAANVSTFTVRVGTTGTTPASDTTATAALATTAGATTGTAVPFTAQILMTVRAIGASTVIECGLTVINTGVTGIMSVATGGAVAATGAYNNNAALFLNISYKAAVATTTSTFQLANWEVLAQ